MTRGVATYHGPDPPGNEAGASSLKLVGIGMSVVLACAPFAGWLTPATWPVSIAEVLLLIVTGAAVLTFGRRRSQLGGELGWIWGCFLLVAAASSLGAILRAYPYLDGVLFEQCRMRWTGVVAFDQADVLYTMRALATLLVGALAFAVARVAGQCESSRNRMLLAVLASAIVAAGWATVQRILGWDLPRHWMIHEPHLKRVGGPLQDPNLLGSLLCLAIPSIWAKSKTSPWWWLGFAASLCALLLTWSRVAILAIVLVGLYAALDGRSRPWRFVTVVAGLFVAGLLAAAAAARYGSTGVVESFLAKSDVTDLDRFLLGRQKFWLAGVRMIWDFPLLGSGPGTAFARLSSYGPKEFENLHDYYMQVGAETGLIGLAAFVALLWKVLGATGLSSTAETRALRAGIVAFLVTCLTGHPLLDSRMQVAFWGMAGLLVGSRVKVRELDCTDDNPDQPQCRARMWGPPGRIACAGLLGVVLGTIAASARTGMESVTGLGLYSVRTGVDRWPLGESLWPDRADQWWWMGRRCRMRIPRVADAVALPILVQTPDLETHPVSIELTLFGEVRLRRKVHAPGAQRLVLRIPPSERTGQLVDLGVRVDRTWSPALLGSSTDRRDLGLALGTPVWYEEPDQDQIPNGFYAVERDELGRPFHWTGQVAQARVRCAGPSSGTLALRALVGHSDIDSNSVRVRWLIGNKVSGERLVRSVEWLNIGPLNVSNGEIFTVELSRPWTPEEDPRELGVRIDVDSQSGSAPCTLDIPAEGRGPPPLRRARLVGLDGLD